MAKTQNENVPAIPCCPELIRDNHCDVINFSRVLNYPVAVDAAGARRLVVQVILHFRFSRCTLGLTQGDPVYSTTLLPGERVRLATTDRRSRFSFDSESKLSYRSEQISEEQYYLTAFQKYMADAASAQSGHGSSSSDSHWDFHGDAKGSVNPFSLSASASTNASGNHNAHSVFDYLNQQKSHVESAANQAVSSTRKAHSVSIGEVSSRTHVEGESEDHFEASSREFSNYNRCHAVTYMFYRLNKKQQIKLEIVAIERRIKDDNAPVGGVLEPATSAIPIALVPQDLPATSVLKSTVASPIAAGINTNTAFRNFSLSAIADTGIDQANIGRKVVLNEQVSGTAIEGDVREKALKQVDAELVNRKIITNQGAVSEEIKQRIEYSQEFSLPTAGIIVKGCLDDCDVCEPLLKEKMQLENDLLRRQIELLDKAQQYRCCPAPAETPGA